MNIGLLGFPAGGNQGEVTGIKKWWNYIQGSTQVPSRPSRTHSTWYFNDTDEELELIVQIFNTSAGIEIYVADYPVAAASLTFNSLMTDNIRAVVACLGLSHVASSGTYHMPYFKVPPGQWYYLKPNTTPSIQNWSEYRRKP